MHMTKFLAKNVSKLPVEDFHQNMQLSSISREEMQARLKKQFAKSLDGGEFHDALMWLEEYHLCAGEDEWSAQAELKIVPELKRVFAARWQNKKWMSILPPENQADQVMCLADFKNVFAGQRAFIIGNGPSLNDIDFSRLKNEVTFGVNSIFLKTDTLGFQPSFYLVEDWFVAEDRAARIGLQSDSIKIFGYFLQERQSIGLDYETIFANIPIDYRNYPGFPHFSIDAKKRLWFGGTVSYLSLQLAYYMGFSEIYLVGFDHHYVIPKDARRSGPDNINILSCSADPNHFSPDYFGANFRWHDPMVDRMETAYRKAKHAYELAGRKIFNATRGGRLEVFERIDYEDVFTKGKPAVTRGMPANEWLAQYRRIACETLYARRAQGQQEIPELSVIVPVYNVEKYIHKCLSSIVSQTFLNMEIIVVDDGSTDLSMDIVRRFCHEDPRIRIITQENQGLGPARNTGLKASLAEYVLFVDSDDFIDRDMCFELMHKAKSEYLDIVSCYFWKNVNGQDSPSNWNIGNYRNNHEAVKSLLQQKRSSVAWGRLYRKHLFLDNDIFFPAIFHEDFSTVYLLYLYAKNIDTVPKNFYHWVQRPGSISNSFTKEHIISIFKTLDMRYQQLKSNRVLWSTWKADYYAGLWDLIDFLLQKIKPFMNSDRQKFNLLQKTFLLNFIEREFFTSNVLSYLKKASIKKTLTELFPTFEEANIETPTSKTGSSITNHQVQLNIETHADKAKISLEQRYRKAPRWKRILSLLLLDRPRLKSVIKKKYGNRTLLLKMSHLIPK